MRPADVKEEELLCLDVALDENSTDALAMSPSICRRYSTV
jgi:hypothetical protein